MESRFKAERSVRGELTLRRKCYRGVGGAALKGQATITNAASDRLSLRYPGNHQSRDTGIRQVSTYLKSRLKSGVDKDLRAIYKTVVLKPISSLQRIKTTLWTITILGKEGRIKRT